MKRTYYYPTVPSISDFDRIFDLALPNFGRLLGQRQTEGAPPADFYEDKDNYYVKVELPGVRKDDVNVAFDDGVVALSASRVRKQDDKEHRLEYKRSFRVPEGVSSESITADYGDGLLTLTLPKVPQLKPRQIEIQ
ncbi:Hsp20/alpha crystallin family protein [Rubellicoccus peritrichatus]|uniref:Hsp20/alpha crystallin family protein n=1 Tax=Rubellicoccus peritrichatus TaxID=3080537 RepID=A0AAQ3L9Y1_9BACT|nr:Hsp20/alpha crystallin family protein [Puniceicoccus sp. CR14]WOO41811.1 Hsp20/alpha crystallin family protein [Puniceicoccus sp. CR14]